MTWNQKGFLSKLCVEQDFITSVTYDFGINPSMKIVGSPQIDIPNPNEVKHREHLFGRAIPWLIDYEKLAEMILINSKLEEFSKLIKK
jgi:hypothetical protein